MHHSWSIPIIVCAAACLLAYLYLSVQHWCAVNKDLKWLSIQILHLHLALVNFSDTRKKNLTGLYHHTSSALATSLRGLACRADADWLLSALRSPRKLTPLKHVSRPSPTLGFVNLLIGTQFLHGNCVLWRAVHE